MALVIFIRYVYEWQENVWLRIESTDLVTLWGGAFPIKTRYTSDSRVMGKTAKAIICVCFSLLHTICLHKALNTNRLIFQVPH